MSNEYLGLIGVAVGGFIAIGKDFFASQFKQRKNAEYLAIQVTCILDEFVNKCYDVVEDNGTYQGRPAGMTKYGEEFYEPQTNLPASLEYPDDVDWKSINASIMYRILMFPIELTITNQIILASHEHSIKPLNEEIFESRQSGYAKLGIEALNITSKLRKTYNLPERTFEFYDPKEKFECIIQKYKR